LGLRLYCESSVEVVGLGGIAEEVMKRAIGFDMSVLYHDRTRRLALEQKYGVEYRSLDALLREVDFLTIRVHF
jgi:lactate dehydrogenase-like 2-hydroxyacid dehydrogenase